jgi:hypothetical protein
LRGPEWGLFSPSIIESNREEGRFEDVGDEQIRVDSCGSYIRTMKKSHLFLSVSGFPWDPVNTMIFDLIDLIKQAVLRWVDSMLLVGFATQKPPNPGARIVAVAP